MFFIYFVPTIVFLALAMNYFFKNAYRFDKDGNEIKEIDEIKEEDRYK